VGEPSTTRLRRVKSPKDLQLRKVGIMARELHILIIGAGLSGLSASIQCALSGHAVTVLEGARELAEVCRRYLRH
jgi:NADPH-dependent 2,4-dienoyl-CoA reductase/sulfur reductase-like enzyme